MVNLTASLKATIAEPSLSLRPSLGLPCGSNSLSSLPGRSAVSRRCAPGCGEPSRRGRGESQGQGEMLGLLPGSGRVSWRLGEPRPPLRPRWEYIIMIINLGMRRRNLGKTRWMSLLIVGNLQRPGIAQSLHHRMLNGGLLALL